MSLATTFHRVFALDTFRNDTVKNRMDMGWEIDTLRRSPRGGVEQD